MKTMINFSGVKVALITADHQLLIIQRDKKPGLRYSGLWDFAGGGREGQESPFECAFREIQEELGIKINQKDVLWQKLYPAMHESHINAYFIVIKLHQSQIKSIHFGDEGLGWKMISIDEFMSSKDSVEPLKGRLRDYLLVVNPKVIT